MARASKKSKNTEQSAATVGYEAQLWQMADALRGSMDAAEYKHVVLGLIFLKYISDAFEDHHAKLVAEQATGADPEDPDEYRAQSIFWVPPEARWAHLKDARTPVERLPFVILIAGLVFVGFFPQTVLSVAEQGVKPLVQRFGAR